jgi:hypothetical protein
VAEKIKKPPNPLGGFLALSLEMRLKRRVPWVVPDEDSDSPYPTHEEVEGFVPDLLC